MDSARVPYIQEEEGEGRNASEGDEISSVIWRVPEGLGGVDGDIGLPATKNKEACHGVIAHAYNDAPLLGGHLELRRLLRWCWLSLGLIPCIYGRQLYIFPCC